MYLLLSYVPVLGTYFEDAVEQTFEVYLLYKSLLEDVYTNAYASHHICLLKGGDGTTYYTQLHRDNLTCRIEFEKHYKFLSNEIYYSFFGKAKMSVNSMRKFAKESKFNGSTYVLGINDCQWYAKDFIEFISAYSKNKTEKKYCKDYTELGFHSRSYYWNWKQIIVHLILPVVLVYKSIY